MFIRAHRNTTKGRIEFFRTDLDGPQRDARTGELICLGDNHESLPGDSELEFLDWKTGKSKYDYRGRRIA